MSDSNATELLPCPFCGGEALETLAGVSCTKCEATMMHCMGNPDQKCVDDWNNRAYEQRIADLEKLIKDMYSSWCICHNHPGTYQTIESMELSAFKTRMEALIVGDAE